MANPKSQFRTNRRLWAVAAVCWFVALGFFELTGGYSKADTSLWGDNLRVLLTRDYLCPSFDLLFALGMQVVMCAVPALVLGWVTQAVVVIIRSPKVRPAEISS
jgi:hypothetical protein